MSICCKDSNKYQRPKPKSNTLAKIKRKNTLQELKLKNSKFTRIKNIFKHLVN